MSDAREFSQSQLSPSQVARTTEAGQERPSGSTHESPGAVQAPVLTGLGDRIRRLRVSRDLGQQELATHAGMDSRHLAGVETGETTPTLDVLSDLAGALDVALAELFTETKPGPAAVVLRGDEVPTADEDGVCVQVLTPRAVMPGPYAVRYVLSPSRDSVRPVKHEGHDWLYVLSGTLHIEFEQGETTLRAGDSVSFSGRVPHRLSAIGEDTAEFLAVGATLLTSGRPAGSG